MLTLHEKTGRYLCRAGFVLACLLPVLLVLGWIGMRHLPGRVAAYEAALSEKLAVTVTVEDVSYPRPGVTILEHLRLFDPETHKELVRVGQVEVKEEKDRTTFTLSQCEVQGTRLPRLWKSLHGRMIYRGQGQLKPVRLLAETVTVYNEGSAKTAETLREVEGVIQSTEKVTQAVVEFRTEGMTMPESIQLRAIRYHRVASPVTRLEVKTGRNKLALAMWTPLVPAIKNLGEEAWFCGTAWAVKTENGWQGEGSGRFLNVHLGRLITDHFPHKLDGRAEVVLEQIRVHNGRMIEASGWIESKSGVVSRSLIQSVTESFHLTSYGTAIQQLEPLVAYDRLAFHFAINANGVLLSPLREKPGSVSTGILFHSTAGFSLSKQDKQPAPVIAIVRALSSRSEPLVPATAETNPLLQRLPLPVSRVP